MSALRVVDTGLAPARWNIAMTAALAELHGTDKIPDTLRFQRFEPCVLVGRNQDVGREARIGRCREKGVALARRLTGGGAVYMDAGILSWEIVAGRKRFGRDLAEAAKAICSAVADGLATLGVRAEFSPPNAIVAEGRKLSGASGYFEGTTLVHEGTVLVDFDIRDMADVLRPPAAADPALLARRVTSLAELLGKAPAIDEVRRAIAAGLAKRFDFSMFPAPLSTREFSLAEALHAAEFGSDRFVFGEDARIVA